jgi:diguanylate cyclase (GGDEF)-like protein
VGLKFPNIASDSYIFSILEKGKPSRFHAHKRYATLAIAKPILSDISLSNFPLSNALRRTMSDPIITDDPLLGRTLDGKYQLETCIGIGGMATVYLARRKHIGDRVAVKVLNTGMPLSDIDLQRFELEARSSAKIKHPNIVSVFDFGSTSDGLMYLVMELLEGSSLERELEERNVIDLDRTLELIQPVCEAVNAAHAEGLIHRDLKPSNILLHRLKDGSEIVKVVDFGVAKVTNMSDTAFQGRLTKTGYLIGTPHYMSPEQIREQEITLQSDIYSLGVIIYEMLAGQLPFNADNVIDLLLAHLENLPQPLRDLSATIPAGVDEAVLRALNKDPVKRQISARELFQEIYTAVRGTPAPGTGEHASLRRTTPTATTDQHLKQRSISDTNSKIKRANTMVYDTLTGLYNNMFMSLRLENEITEAKASGDRVSILLFGIDGLKSVNQKYGFVIGDWAIKEFGSWLEKTVGDGGVVGRYRGDEFVVILPKTDGKSSLQVGGQIIDRINSEMMIEINESGQQLSIAASAGVAQFPGDGEIGSELIEQAQLSLRQAKSQGQGQIYWLKQVQTLTTMGPTYSFDLFVGRKAELEKLHREFDRALTMNGRPVYIIGDTGVGKKRLAEEFRRRLAGKDVLYLQGRFFESSKAIPYKTIYDSLHSHLAVMLEENPDMVRSLFGALSERIMKDFQEGESFRFFNSTVQTGTEQEKYIIFDYLTKIFIGLSRERPLIFFLEDMQWADSLSLEFLSYLNHNGAKSRMMVIGCARTEGLPDKHPLRVWLRNMSRSGCEIIQLQPLSEPEVGSMIEGIFTRIVFSPGTIKMLYRETKGNPYFLVEIIRYLIDEGRITFRDGVWCCDELENISLPRSVIDVVEALLGRLEGDVIEVFSKAAVIGEEFSFELLQRVTKLDEDELLDHIDAGLKSQIIKEREGSNNDEIYTFYHAMVQKVLYGRLNRRLRRSLHAQVGEAIEKLNRSNPARAAGELAFHFHASGDYQRSLKYSIEAGLRAWRALSIDEAEKYFSWGEEAAEKLGVMPGAEEPAEAPDLEELKLVSELTLNYGRLLVNVGKLEHASKQLEGTLELANRMKDEPLQARAYSAMAEKYEASSQFQQAIEYCNRSLAIAERLNHSAIKASNYCIIGTAQDRMGQYDQALESFNKALEFARETPGSADNSIAQRELAYTLLKQGCLRDARNCAEESIKISQTSGDRLNEMIGRSILGQIYFNQGDMKRASEQYDSSLKMAGELNRRRGQAIELYNIGEVHRAQGNYRQAIDCIQRSLEISRDVGERQYEALAKLSLGLIYKASDSPEQAFEALNQALQQQRDVSNKGAEAAALLALAELHHELNNEDEAEYVTKQAGELIDKLGNPQLSWRRYYVSARLHFTAGRIDEARDETRASVGIIESMCDQLSADINRETFLADKRDVYNLLTELMEMD